MICCLSWDINILNTSNQTTCCHLNLNKKSFLPVTANSSACLFLLLRVASAIKTSPSLQLQRSEKTHCSARPRMLDSVILQKERLRLSAVRKDTQTHTHQDSRHAVIRWSQFSSKLLDGITSHSRLPMFDATTETDSRRGVSDTVDILFPCISALATSKLDSCCLDNSAWLQTKTGTEPYFLDTGPNILQTQPALLQNPRVDHQSNAVSPPCFLAVLATTKCYDLLLKASTPHDWNDLTSITAPKSELC